jgi:putative DNA methylase
LKGQPKRLIEVDMPIKRISEQARREKDMRRRHVPLIYIWPATRPPAACRAIICAALWPDPADPFCPDTFRTELRRVFGDWSKNNLGLLSPASFDNFNAANKNPSLLNDNLILRKLLLDLIAEFSSWDNANKEEFLHLVRALTKASHESLGTPGVNPLVVDPFAGGGAIPLEALRVGADAFGSDSNPVAALLNKFVLEYVPTHGTVLLEELQEWEKFVIKKSNDELARFYPRDDEGGTPIVYLWARTVVCEGPKCGAEVPLIKGLWLAKKGKNQVALRLVPNHSKKHVEIEIIQNAKSSKIGEGTVRRGGATCPVCGYTSPASSVRKQLKRRKGGTRDAKLFCVVTTRDDEQGRSYRPPTQRDQNALRKAELELSQRERTPGMRISLLPDEPTPKGGGSGAGRAFSQRNYGLDCWGDLFTTRQGLALSIYAQSVRDYVEQPHLRGKPVAAAVATMLSLVVNRLADLNASLCGWQLSTPNAAHVFVRWAIQMVMDFAEVNPLAGAGGSPESCIRRATAGIKGLIAGIHSAGTAENASATKIPLPDDCAAAFITDPPYYDAVPYADLSDFFNVWLKRSLPEKLNSSFQAQLSPKDDECIVDEVKGKDRAYFEQTIATAMTEGRRILALHGIGVVVFAHKSTAGWEAQLQAMVDAGWIITASWPIDTEMGSRLRARNSAVLASSIHIVCRPRESASELGIVQQVGDWRDVLDELPLRIHDWMPRLAEEGVVGADAIFACLGPSLEIFSRYSHVEKANGEQVGLKEYLVYVWAAVAKEALAMVFKGADASGFEEDARLTAIWLWTLFAEQSADDEESVDEADPEDDDEKGGKQTKGYILEYDAARKIAQGLGAHLESLSSLVEIKGDIARLLPVAERTRRLFGKDENEAPTQKRKKKSPQLQLGFAEELEQVEEAGAWGAKGAPPAGLTVLDRVHQSMILFAAGRGEALRRFLVDEGVGRDERFWRLAQVLSFLYPKTSDEKRWIDGVLARKKGLGF